LHQDTKSTGHLIISPRQEHEINFGEDMVKMLPENGIAVGDSIESNTLFTIRLPIGNGTKTIVSLRNAI
jgi:hypothetical protein